MPTVFITGAARRIGRGLALGFAERGYDVGITYNTSSDAAEKTVEELRSKGVQAEAVRAELRSPESIHDALYDLSASLGVPDVLVNNAGVYPPQRSIEDLTIENFEDTLAINTTPLLSIARMYREMRKGMSGNGRLIALSSLGAVEIWKDRIDYNVSKAALVQMVKALARSLAPDIAVNTVAPGAIVFPDEPNAADATVVNTDRIPMGRYGTAEDIFDAVWFFATATTYITGQYLAVEGGYHLVR